MENAILTLDSCRHHGSVAVPIILFSSSHGTCLEDACAEYRHLLQNGDIHAGWRAALSVVLSVIILKKEKCRKQVMYGKKVVYFIYLFTQKNDLPTEIFILMVFLGPSEPVSECISTYVSPSG